MEIRPPTALEVARDVIYRTVDDKTIIIWAVAIIVIVALFKITDPKELTGIVNSALSGLFGIAVGRAWGGVAGNLTPTLPIQPTVPKQDTQT